jgi:hypothetical protein
LSLPRAWALVPALVLGCLAAAVWASGRNTALFQGLNAAASGLPAALWAMLTVCGSVLGAIALLAPTLKTQPRWLASAFLAAPLAVLFSEGSKRYFDVLRPAGVLAADSFNLIGQKLYVHAFPSGHSTTAFVAAAAIVLAWPGPNGAIAPGCWCSARPAWSPFRASRWAPTGRSTCSPAPPAAGCAAPGGLAVGPAAVLGRPGRRPRDGHRGAGHQPRFYLWTPASRTSVSFASASPPGASAVPPRPSCRAGRISSNDQTHPRRRGVRRPPRLAARRRRWRGIGEVFMRLDGLTLGLAVAGFMLSYLLRALRVFDEFRAHAGGRFGTCLRIVLVHNAMINVVPFRGGEAAFPLLLRQSFGVALPRAIASLFWFRLQDAFVVMALAAIVWPGIPRSRPRRWPACWCWPGGCPAGRGRPTPGARPAASPPSSPRCATPLPKAPATPASAGCGRSPTGRSSSPPRPGCWPR